MTAAVDYCFTLEKDRPILNVVQWVRYTRDSGRFLGQIFVKKKFFD